MNENGKQTAAIVVGAIAAVGVLAVKCTKTVRAGRKERKEIKANEAKDIEAMRTAALLVKERLVSGTYRGQSLKTIMSDLEFETMVAREEW
jgi:hypothetical protein